MAATYINSENSMDEAWRWDIELTIDYILSHGHKSVRQAHARRSLICQPYRLFLLNTITKPDSC
jgi:hypothetical protein